MAEKKILVEFLGKNGAGTVFTLEVAKALRNAGMEVWVLLSSGILNRKSWEAVDDELMHVCFIETGNKKTFVPATLKFMTGRGKVLSAQTGIEFDYALRTFPHPWLEFIERKLNVKRVFYILHDPVPHTGTERFRRAISRRNVKTADDIIVLSEKFIEPVVELYGVEKQRVHFMKHGLLPVSVQEDDVSRIEAEKLAAYDIVYLFFGRIDKYKGLHVLAKAYEKIKAEEKSNIALVVAGSGGFSEYEEEYAALNDAYVYNHYINDKELAALFSLKNTVVVLPYLDATQSGVTTVAADYLRPVIASDSGALKEQLMNGEAGIFCKAGDADDLADAMKRFICEPDLMENEIMKMSDFKKTLQWDQIIKDFFDKAEQI